MALPADCPRKILLGDLARREPPLSVWVQGTVKQTVGSDLLILSDGSGNAKVTCCSTADGGATRWLQKGVYCCVVGTAVSTRGLPEVQASKLVELAQPAAAVAWPSEVREADLLLDGKIEPTV